MQKSIVWFVMIFLTTFFVAALLFGLGVFENVLSSKPQNNQSGNFLALSEKLVEQEQKISEQEKLINELRNDLDLLKENLHDQESRLKREIEADNPGNKPNHDKVTNSEDNFEATKENVRKLVDEQIQAEIKRRENEEHKKYEKEKQKWENRKRTIDEIALELEFSPRQKEDCKNLYRKVREAQLKLMFGLEKDEDFRQILTQLEQAKYDDELKEKLQNKVATNYKTYGLQLLDLENRLNQGLRKILPKEKHEQLHRYEVIDPEIPDIKEALWGDEDK